MAKKKEKGNNSAMLAIIAIVAIVAIVFLVTRSQGSKAARPDIAVSIDSNGNVYDGSNNYVGKLADPDIKFYDEQGNLMGQATFNVGNNLVGDVKSTQGSKIKP